MWSSLSAPFSSPNERVANWHIDKSRVNPEPERIVIFDDMLTTGSHYKGMELALRGEFSAVSIVGVFLTRRIFGVTDEDDFPF